MGILDGIVEWIAEQVMNILDLITTSVLGALGCSMDTFLRYFPAAETMYQVFLALGIRCGLCPARTILIGADGWVPPQFAALPIVRFTPLDTSPV